MTKPASPFRYFNSSPEVIRLVVMMYVKFPLSLRNVEDLLHERGIDISYETVRFWWNRFGPMFAAEIRKKRVDYMRGQRHWKWHLDEMYVKINGETRYLWRAVDHEGEVLESFATKERDMAAALKFMKKLMKRHGTAKVITTGAPSHQPPDLQGETLGGTLRAAVSHGIARDGFGGAARRRRHVDFSLTAPPTISMTYEANWWFLQASGFGWASSVSEW
jgi:hypothetical protein